MALEHLDSTLRQERYGPYVELIGSAYLWGTFGAPLLVIDGIAVLLFGRLPGCG